MVNMANILVLHGPNLNMLGFREPQHYGRDTLQSINEKLANLSAQLGHDLSSTQSNSEGDLVGRIQACLNDETHFVIINPAAFTHTSIALRDALLAVAIPFIEVHLSNLHRREPFRQHSYFSDIALGTISGLGGEGYLFALRYAHTYLNANKHELIRS
jgi:3-dehydroquinate dehydratase-2